MKFIAVGANDWGEQATWNEGSRASMAVCVYDWGADVYCECDCCVAGGIWRARNGEWREGTVVARGCLEERS